MNRLEVKLFSGPVHRAPGDAMLVPLPEDERPLRGDAGIADWRLVGTISDLVASGFCSGRLGEATLVPAGGRLAAERILLFGVGPVAGMHGRGLERALTFAGVKLLGIRARAAVLALPEGLEVATEARTLLLGLGRALGVVHGGGRLTLVVPNAAHHGRVFRAVWPEALGDLHACGVEGTLQSPESLDRVPAFAMDMEAEGTPAAS
jgi:hypothetical protein